VSRPLSNVIGIDDAPSTGRGAVPLIGAVFSRTRLDGLLIDRVRRDGTDSTRAIARMVQHSRFSCHVQAVIIQGIAVAGFNVIDVHALHAQLGLPVLVVARRRPNLERIHAALVGRVRGGARKWELIQRAGPMEPLGGVFVQRVGLESRRAERLLRELTVHGALPEPLRVAHLIAGAVVTGTSHGRA
jgi:endonuclease V-like protein UPF0215 family